MVLINSSNGIASITMNKLRKNNLNIKSKLAFINFVYVSLLLAIEFIKKIIVISFDNNKVGTLN